jgi:hypothetical protein
MNHQLYQQYLKEYTLDALEHSGDNVSQAADYLERQSRPGLFSKNRLERRAALERAKKVFASSRERSWFVVLKSLGFDDLAKGKL